MERISVVYAGNRGIFDGILISALSLVKKTHGPVDIYILTMDLSDHNEKYLPIDERCRDFLCDVCRRENPDCRVILKDVGALYREHLIDSPNAQSSYTPYALLRLLLDLTEGMPRRLLYLDADTVINEDVHELFCTELDGAEFAAAFDHYGKIFMGPGYVNSGVMVLDLEQIKKTRLFEKCRAALNKRKIFLPDQTALNRYVKKKKILHRRFNEQKRFCDGTVIQHFSMTIIWHPFFPFFYTKNIKPWQTERVRAELTHKYDGLLDEYLTLKGEFYDEK